MTTDKVRQFQPGDRVIHKKSKDIRDYGEVMDIPPNQQKPGWIAVYFQRKVWCKPENLRYLTERQHNKEITPSLKDYWISQKEAFHENH